MSSQLTQQILGLTIGLFNMSAGASYLSNFSGYIQQVQTNWSLTDDEAMAELARALVLSPTFQSQLIGKDTAESRALMVLSHFGLQQESALLTSTIQAINAFSKETYQAELAMLIWGYTKALLFDSQVQALYLDASRLFNQKLSTATVFSVIEANASTHIDTLRDTLTQVDVVDMSSLAQAQSRVLQGIDTTQLPAMSSLPVAALDSELSWSEATLSYSYNTRIPSDYYGMRTDATLYGNLTTGWQTPSAAIRATTDAIMQNINGFIATPITLVTNNGDIRINLIPTVNDVAAFAYYPGNTGVSGDVFIDRYITQTTSYLTAGGYGNFTIAHEIGHALGLKHPFEDGVILPDSLDHRVNTIMSYTDFRPYVPHFTYSNTQISVNYQQVFAQGFMVYDIAALQNLYGVDSQQNTGNTLYTFDSTPFYRTIWDAGGVDTLDFSATTHPNLVRLTSGSYSNVNYRDMHTQIIEQQQWYKTQGVDYADSFVMSSLQEIEPLLYTGEQALGVAYGAIIENAIGGSANDVFYDNAVDNQLWGGAGDDVFYLGAGGYDYIDGGEGEDALMLSLNYQQIQLDYGSEAIVIVGTTFAVSLVSVERLVFLDQTLVIS